MRVAQIQQYTFTHGAGEVSFSQFLIILLIHVYGHKEHEIL